MPVPHLTQPTSSSDQAGPKLSFLPLNGASSQEALADMESLAQAGLPFTLSQRGPSAFAHTAHPWLFAVPANRKGQQRPEGAVRGRGTAGAEGGAGGGNRGPRPPRSRCGGAGKSRHCQAVNLLRPVSKKIWSTEALPDAFL